MTGGHPVPGSTGEHELQQRYGSARRAAAFYDKQMLDHLNPLMREYLARQEMMFVASSDGDGGMDCSFRSGEPGFVRVLDERTVVYPEFRGNGVMATLGNLVTHPHVGLLFVDFFEAGVGLHINGAARILDGDAVDAFAPLLARLTGVDLRVAEGTPAKRTPERWVMVEIEEAYIHCSKHIPILARVEEDAARAERRSGDVFEAKATPRPWAAKEALAPPPPPPPTFSEAPERVVAPVDWPRVAEAANVLAELADAQGLQDGSAQ